MSAGNTIHHGGIRDMDHFMQAMRRCLRAGETVRAGYDAYDASGAMLHWAIYDRTGRRLGTIGMQAAYVFIYDGDDDAVGTRLYLRQTEDAQAAEDEKSDDLWAVVPT